MITNKSQSVVMPNLNADLEWLVNAPDLLLTAPMQKQLNNLINASEILTKTDNLPETFPPLSSGRLGLYFEQLFLHQLQQNPGFELQAANLQVHLDGMTAGEFDCLIQSLTTNETIHCEVAVKFYLKIGHGNVLSDWLGPNVKDSLAIKYLHLLNHQLALSNKPEVAQWLNTRDIHIIQRALLSRGRLYYPLADYLNEQFIFPKEVNADHQKGFWCDIKAFEEFVMINPALSWFQLPKPFWFADITNDKRQELVTFSTDQFRHLQQVVAMNSSGEEMRGFVVTDEWYNKALNRLADDNL